MPELCRFAGIVICIMFKDNDKHHKPHIHAYYNEYAAVIGIDGEVIEGNLPRRQLRMVSGWVALHEDELYKVWNDVVRGLEATKIAPLQ